ncbi:MAG: CmcJ/NvfI family oxidoreductase [Myxococcota bacterium]
MSESLEMAIGSGPVVGSFNYLRASVAPSLFRNGRLLTRRDGDGNDGGTEGLDLERREVEVADGRALEGEARCTLARNGFELATCPPTDPELDFFAHGPVVDRYYDECAEIVRAASGARDVFAFDHNVRPATGKRSGQRLVDGQQVQPPARVVHGDYTLTSAPQRLRDLAGLPADNDTYRRRLGSGETLLDADRVEAVVADGRFALINVWRNVADEPVARDPLALCDGQSVLPDELAVFEIHYADRIGENYFARYAPRHRWTYYPEMTRDEVLLIKQWDSNGPLARSGGKEPDASNPEAPCTFSFHSAFYDDATPPDAPARWSIEVRCVALFD